MIKPILKLKHGTYPGHKETWHLQDDNTIYVESLCPSNSPAFTTTTFTPVEALRQYALLTSPVEGWEIDKDMGWHEYVEKLEVK